MEQRNEKSEWMWTTSRSIERYRYTPSSYLIWFIIYMWVYVTCVCDVCMRVHLQEFSAFIFLTLSSHSNWIYTFTHIERMRVALIPYNICGNNNNIDNIIITRHWSHISIWYFVCFDCLFFLRINCMDATDWTLCSFCIHSTRSILLFLFEVTK